MALLNKKAILEAEDLTTEDIYIPEWEGTVRVRGLNGSERDSFEMKMAAANKSGATKDLDFRASLVVKCIVDENGERIFTDKEVPQLAKKSGAALDRVFDVVQRLSGIGKKAKEDDAADFDQAAGGDSPSA
ncbi:MAG: hypothetical protein HLX51_11695 [Micrococcaceae bacterium]|nr:hypothetical protein [Micrococcaceae bacterium]